MRIEQKYLRQVAVIVFIALLPFGCIEPIDIKTETFESALVVEAVISDNLEPQEISLSRTFRLEEDGPSPESNARVTILDDLGNEFLFEESTPGKYVSVDPFKAEENRSYTLEVVTQENRMYSSEPETLPEAAEISELVAERITYQGEDGMALLVDVEGPDKNAGFYRFTYEETYKIISPFSYPLDLRYENGRLVEVPKTKEERICYNTENSKEIILASTRAQVDNDLDRLIVRFINSENPILSHRYSILVKQFSISQEAYSYYETLKDFSGSENLFSQNQPGFINGNMFSVSNPDEKVIGFFSLAAVEQERIFFDFEDFYIQEEAPGHFIECVIARPEITVPEHIEALGEMLASGRVKYLGYTQVAGGPGEGPYMIVDAACVDCTELGSNQKPDFWEE